MIKSLSCIFAFIMLVMLLSSCNKEEMDPNQLLGKTKTEVLELAFNHFQRTKRGEINIMIETPIGKNHNFYYKNITEALNDEQLMRAERWELFVEKQTTFFISCKEVYIELFFKDKKVFKYTLNTWNKT